jgi:predicted transcriptional regulator
MSDAAPASVLKLTTDIVASYVEHNRLSSQELPGLIQSVYAAMAGGEPAEAAAAPAPVAKTKAQIAKSITPDGLISFVDGRPYKMLRRHLAANGMTPADYKARYGLPTDYPMTAPAYSEKRSQFAKAAGLGQATRGRRTK